MQKYMAAALTFIALAVPVMVQGQVPGWKTILNGQKAPLTLALKDLDTNWRRFTISGGSLQEMMMLGPTSEVQTVYYTRGMTVSVGSETCLVAYSLQGPPLNMTALIRNRGHARAIKLTPDSTLVISLLNLRSLDRLDDICQFSLETEIGDNQQGQKEAQSSTTSDENLKQLGAALLRYVEDHNGMLPELNDPQKTRTALAPYLRDTSVFLQPGANKPYLANTTVAKKRLSQVPRIGEVVAFYESEPAADNTRGIVYLDGHSDRIPEQEWTRIKTASKLP